MDELAAVEEFSAHTHHIEREKERARQRDAETVRDKLTGTCGDRNFIVFRRAFRLWRFEADRKEPH